MGLLDGIPKLDTPQGQGLLAAAFQLMGSRGSFGESIGKAGMTYMGATQQAQESASNNELRRLQMDSARHKAKQDQMLRDAAKRATISPDMANAMSMGPMQDGSAVPQVQPGFNRQAFANAYESIDPINGFNYAQSISKDESPLNVAPGASLIDRRTFKPLFTAPKEQSVPSAVQEYNFAKDQGYPGSFEQWSTSQKRAGATNVSNRTEVKMGESIANQVGPMVKETYTAANGAVQQVDAANRIIRAVDSGKVIAGPLAGGRLKIAQIGQLLGVSGKNDADTIARSREVIRGLSEMTLQGRKQMTGQGAITESEGALAEKANSGNIEDLTPAEIKQLAKASARAARFTYQQHMKNMENLSSDPGTAGMAKFYKPMPMPTDIVQQGGAVGWGDLK